MRLASVETVLPAGIPSQLPARSLQATSQSASFLKLALMFPAAIALLVPYLIIAERLANSEAFRAALNARPVAAFQVAVALAFWTILFAWPLKQLTESFARMRSVKIDAETVEVTDSGLMGHETWSAPLAEYSGIAHHVRTSLSGVRHELVLVHPDRALTVLLAIAPKFSQPQIDELCALLVCPEVPSKELYNFRLPAIAWPRARRVGLAA
jgi:hypothetical protein